MTGNAEPPEGAAPPVDQPPTPGTKPRSHRYAELDGLRGLAALGVLYFHFFGIFPDMFERDEWIAPGASFGFYGVHLFFVVSGFVILMTLQRTSAPMDFVFGRAGRLYPTYWVAVIVAAGVLATGIFEGTVAASETPLTLFRFVANLTMAQRFANIRDLDHVYWTLAFELTFYFWAFLLLVTKRVAQAERFAAGYLVLRVILILSADQFELGRRINTLAMTEWGHLFVIGMVFYRMRAEGRTPWRHVMVGFAFASHALHAELASTVAVAIVVAIFYGLEFGRLKWLAARPLTWLGSISYALYATHELFGWALMRWLRTQGVPYAGAVVIATVSALALAWLIHRLVELPAMVWVKRKVRTRKAERQAAREELSSERS